MEYNYPLSVLKLKNNEVVFNHNSSFLVAKHIYSRLNSYINYITEKALNHIEGNLVKWVSLNINISNLSTSLEVLKFFIFYVGDKHSFSPKEIIKMMSFFCLMNFVGNPFLGLNHTSITSFKHIEYKHSLY